MLRRRGQIGPIINMRLSKERRRVYNIYNIKEEDSKQRVSCFDNLELNSFPLSESLRISFRVSVSNKLSIIMTGLWAHFITRCLKVYLKECFSRCWSVVRFYERSFYWQSVINILFSPYFLSLARAIVLSTSLSTVIRKWPSHTLCVITHWSTLDMSPSDPILPPGT